MVDTVCGKNVCSENELAKGRSTKKQSSGCVWVFVWVGTKAWSARGDRQRRDFDVKMEGANHDRKCAMQEAAIVVALPTRKGGLSLLQKFVPVGMGKIPCVGDDLRRESTGSRAKCDLTDMTSGLVLRKNFHAPYRIILRLPTMAAFRHSGIRYVEERSMYVCWILAPTRV